MGWSSYRNTRFAISPRPPWVSGRFYGWGSTSGALGTSSSTRWTSAPVIVPNYVTLASIGVECTILSAGKSVRLAIYSNCEDMLYPNARLMQTAALDCGSTGYKSEATSLKLRPGIIWLSCAFNGGATIRTAAQSTALQAFIGPFAGTPNNANIAAVLDCGNGIGAFISDVITDGFPYGFPRAGMVSDTIYFGVDFANVRLEIA